MSFSPDKIKAELQYEIQKRINNSPTKYDIDFYLRKISRLQNDLNQSHDQLSKARVRLRRAEDFQIKYDLLLKQNTTLLNDLDRKEKQCHTLKSKLELVKNQLDDRSFQGQNWSQQKKQFIQQIQLLKSKYEQIQEKKKLETVNVKQKTDHQIKTQIDTIKKQFLQRQQELTTQLRQMRKIIHQKQTVQNVVLSKVQKIRSQKDKQIGRLSKIIESRKEECAQLLKQKNEEIDKLRQKFEKMFNFEIQNLKRNLDEQDEVFNIQINGLRELLGLKNQQVDKLLQQLKENSQQSQHERQYLLKQISAFKDKIYIIQRQNQMQLYNVKQRLSKIHSLEIDTLQKKYNDLVSNLKIQKTNLQKILQQRNKIIQQEKKDAQRIKEQLLDRLRQRDTRINQLQDRIKENGEMNANEMKTLHGSFHQIENQKQNMTSEYQTNVSFLNQQIAKLTSNNELKNNEIKMLHQQIGLIKKHNAEAIQQLEDSWREQRQQRQNQRQKERDRRQKMQQQMRLKQRQWKLKQRELERARQIEQRQKFKLKYICQQLERDIERLNQYIKQLDQNLKKQYKKNQAGTLDTGGVRRQLTGELERQKSQLQAIKRMQVDQIKKRYQIQITRLTNQNEKLNTDLLKKGIALEELQGQFKKLEHINKNIQKINKQKLIEYQKKMATLNSQILLSQNLYKSFMEAKARQKQNYGPRS